MLFLVPLTHFCSYFLDVGGDDYLHISIILLDLFDIDIISNQIALMTCASLYKSAADPAPNTS